MTSRWWCLIVFEVTYANEFMYLFLHFLFRIPDIASFVQQAMFVTMSETAGCKNSENLALSHSRLQVILN